MNKKRVLSTLFIICIVFAATASIFSDTVEAYEVNGYIYQMNLSGGISYSYSGTNLSMNFTNLDSSLSSIKYPNFTNISLITYNISLSIGNYSVVSSHQPRFYDNNTYINITSNISKNIIMLLKPTGTITGCVYVFYGLNPCEIVDTTKKNIIRWFF